MKKSLIAVLVLLLCLLTAGSAEAASCCSPGSGGSYDFLGDSEENINMQGHDQFLRDCQVSSSVPVLSSPPGAKSRMSLDLNDTRSVYIILSRSGADLSGEGSMRGFNGTESLDAAGTVSGNTVSLGINASSGERFEFRLAVEGNRVTGEFNETAPGGKMVQGEAEGRWMPE